MKPPPDYRHMEPSELLQLYDRVVSRKSRLLDAVTTHIRWRGGPEVPITGEYRRDVYDYLIRCIDAGMKALEDNDGY